MAAIMKTMNFALVMPLLSGWFVAAFADQTIDQRSPNIVFILADDLGYGDLGCYGATKVSTPNADRLAVEGLRFTDAHSPTAVCTPTRYGVLTGRYCWRSRLKKSVAVPEEPLLIEPGRMTVASLLRSAGYATGCVGKWHLGFGEEKPDWNGDLKPGPLEVGFDYYFGVPTSNNWPPFVYVENHQVVDRRPDEKIIVEGMSEDQPIPPKRKHEDIALTQTAKAVAFIERNKQRPFFLYFATCNVHLPHTPHPRFQGTSKVGIYGDFIHEFDWSVGEILAALDKWGLTDHTLVIVTSDNGATLAESAPYGHRSCGPWRGQKADAFEGGHRVPFLARWPGRIKPGETSDEVICLTDLLATAAAIVGKPLPPDAGEDSYNILPALLEHQDAKPIREAIVHHSTKGMFAIRQGRWKLIEGLGSGGYLTKPIFVTTQPGEPPGQLYDLQADPGETTNLYAQHPDIVRRLSELLKRYQESGRSRPEKP